MGQNASALGRVLSEFRYVVDVLAWRCSCDDRAGGGRTGDVLM